MSVRSPLAALALALALACAGLDAPATGAPDPGRASGDASVAAARSDADGLLLRRHTLHDQAHPEVVSHTVLLPDGWTAEGGGWWPNPALTGILPSQEITLTAPDGARLRLEPKMAFRWFTPTPQARMMGVPPSQPGTVAEGYPVLPFPEAPRDWARLLGEQVLPKAFPEARDLQVTEVRPFTEFEPLIAPQIADLQRQLPPGMGGVGAQVTGFSLLADARMTLDGAAWDYQMPFAGWAIVLDGPSGRTVTWGVELSFGMLAPEGTLDARLPEFLDVLGTLRADPAWSDQVARHAARMQGIAVAGAAERSRINAASSREVSRILNDGFASRMDAQERGSRSVRNAIVGTADYTAPDGSRTELPGGYDRVFTNGHGEYFLTRDPSVDPNAHRLLDSADWTPMQPAR